MGPGQIGERSSGDWHGRGSGLPACRLRLVPDGVRTQRRWATACPVSVATAGGRSTSELTAPAAVLFSFYHCLFKCPVNRDHFRPVVERLSRDSLPLTMASLVGVGGAGRGLPGGCRHVGDVLPGGSRIVNYSPHSIGGCVRRED